MHTESIARVFGIVLAGAIFVGVLLPFSSASADGYWHGGNWHENSYYDFDYEYPYSHGYVNYNYGYGNQYYYNQPPTCTITLSSYSRLNGYPPSATLSWWSSNATSAYLSGTGSVSTSDTRTVYPYGNNYTLTVYGPGGSGSCYAANTDTAYQYDYYDRGYYGNYYGNYYTPTYSYTYPSTYVVAQPYVQLEKLPYTGFDYGPVVNSLYWAFLLGFALVGAYLVFYMFGMRVAFVDNVAQAAHNQLAFVRRLIRQDQ